MFGRYLYVVASLKVETEGDRPQKIQICAIPMPWSWRVGACPPPAIPMATTDTTDPACSTQQYWRVQYVRTCNGSRRNLYFGRNKRQSATQLALAIGFVVNRCHNNEDSNAQLLQEPVSAALISYKNSPVGIPSGKQ